MISVIVPIYNVEKYLENCLKSIVEQTYRDFELIVVDDGSSDKSVDIANNYLKDKDIKWSLIKKENGGQSSARNAGLRAAKGELISYIDSDDVISPEFLSELVKVLKDDCDFSFCGFEYIKTQNIDKRSEKKESRIYQKDELLIDFLKRTVSFVVPSMLFRKEFLIDNNLFFEESIRFSEDQAFIWDVLLHCQKAVYVSSKMYGYFLRERSIMTGSPYQRVVDSYNEYKNTIDNIFKDYGQYNNIKKIVMPRWELGTLYSSASLLQYEDYKKLYDAMDGTTLLSRVKGIGEIKAILLAIVARISPKLLYLLCRKMTLE